MGYGAMKFREKPRRDPHKLERYVVSGRDAEAIARTIADAVQRSPDKALVLVDTDDRILGVFLDPAEYARLKAMTDLLKSPDIQKKLAGKYEYDPESVITLEELLSR